MRTRWEATGGAEAGEVAGAGRSGMLVDALLDAAENTISLAVRELCCRLGIAGGSFQRSSENLYRAAHLRVSEEIFRQVVESEGQAVIQAAREELLPLDWSAKECLTQTPEGKEVSRVYVSADGVYVPMTTQAEKNKRRETVQQKRREKRPKKGQKRRRLRAVRPGMDQRYKQVYVTSLYNQDKTRRLVSVGRGDAEVPGKLLGRGAALIRLPAADQKVGLIDGAVCLKRNLDGLGLDAVGLDFRHLGEHVALADREVSSVKKPAAGATEPAATVEGSGQPMNVAAETTGRSGASGTTPQGSAWVGEVLSTVKHQGYQPFWKQLMTRRQATGRRGRNAMDKLLHYVVPRQEMIQYDRFLEKGWDIGTGPMEAMCKSTTRRIKGSGMRWDADNAVAMMGLEALHQSHLWDAWWTKPRSRAN